MPQEELIIRNSRFWLVLRPLPFAFMTYTCLQDLYYGRYSTVKLVLATIALAGTLYFLYRCIQNKPRIILSNEGISFCGRGFYSWDKINSFSTVDQGNESFNWHLVLHFPDRSKEEISIQHLETGRKKLIELILSYKGDASLFYQEKR